MVVISIMIIIITQLWLIKNYFNLKKSWKKMLKCALCLSCRTADSRCVTDSQCSIHFVKKYLKIAQSHFHSAQV